MWDWLGQQANAVFGSFQDAYKFVVNLLQSVYSYINTILDMIGAEIQAVWSEIQNVSQGLWGYIYGMYLTLQSLIGQVESGIYRYIAGIVGDIWSFIHGVYSALLWAENTIYGVIYGLVNGVYDYIRRNVWDPLWNYISGVAHDARVVADIVFGLISHPERIVALIGGYLYSAWYSILRRDARAVGRFLTHTMMSAAGEVFDVLENIIAGIL
jgi:hypothetical protein